MFRKTHLDSGMTVVTEQIKNVRSVSLGIWVKVGARSETPETNGISHFLEHMFFKGTERRTAHDIAIDIDSLGGELNAFTSKEGTTFYIKVLDEYLNEGLELISDIFLNSTFPADEIEREKNVIKEEIKMVEDTPDDYIHDLFSRSIWGPSGLGQAVLGKRDTIRSFTREHLIDHIQKHYGASHAIIACAGNFDHDSLINNLSKIFGGFNRVSELQTVSAAEFNAKTAFYTKDLSEVHICLGIKGIPQASEKRYTALLLNTILGGGISSRLFQEIREKRGLAYSVYSFLSSYHDTGVWGVYAGTSKKRYNEVIKRSIEEFMGLSKTLTPAELERAKSQLKGNLILGLESSNRRMQNIASQEIYYGRHYTPKEVMEAVDAVTIDESKALLDELVSGDSGTMALTVMGPVAKDSLKVSL